MLFSSHNGHYCIIGIIERLQLTHTIAPLCEYGFATRVLCCYLLVSYSNRLGWTHKSATSVFLHIDSNFCRQHIRAPLTLGYLTLLPYLASRSSFCTISFLGFLGFSSSFGGPSDSSGSSGSSGYSGSSGSSGFTINTTSSRWISCATTSSRWHSDWFYYFIRNFSAKWVGKIFSEKILKFVTGVFF